MKNALLVAAIVLLLGSTAFGQAMYVGPWNAYYAAPPVYAYRVPAYAYPAPVYAYPPPYAVYSPYSQVVPGPVVAPAPVWVAPPAVVVRGKVYYYGRPVRNVVRAVWP
jgi:hypothetical protein